MESINFILKALYDSNLNRRYVIIINNPGSEKVDILRYAWTKYKMLNILNFQILQTDKDIEMEISFYDPFRENLKISEGTNKVVLNNKSNEWINYVEHTFHKRLKNLHRYPVRIGVIHFSGYLELVKKGNNITYTKTYGEVMNLIAKRMNFTPISIFPPDVQAYGGKLPNGSIVGLTGLLEREEIEMVANIRVADLSSRDNWTLTAIIGHTSRNFISPNIMKGTKHTFADIVGKRTFTGLGIISCVIIGVEYGFHSFNNFYSKSKNFDLGKNALIILAMFLLMSYKIPGTNYNRRFFSAVVLMFMVINLTYQGIMIEILTTESKSQNLKSLEDIINSDLRVLVPIGSREFEPFASFGDQINAKMKNRTSTITEYEDGINQVRYRRDCVFLVLRSFIDVLGYKWYSNETGANLIHMIPSEENMKIYLALMIIKRSPYRHRIDDLVRRISDAGLYDKIYGDSVFITRIRLLQIPKNTNKISFSMDELSVIFYLWCGSLCICILVFFLEVIHKRMIKGNIDLTGWE